MACRSIKLDSGQRRGFYYCTWLKLVIQSHGVVCLLPAIYRRLYRLLCTESKPGWPASFRPHCGIDSLLFKGVLHQKKKETMQTQGQRRRKLKSMLLVTTLCLVTALYMQQAHQSRRYPYRYHIPPPYKRRIRPFLVRRWHPKWIRQNMRISLEEFLTLVPLLRLNGVEYRQRVKPSLETALAVVCYR